MSNVRQETEEVTCLMFVKKVKFVTHGVVLSSIIVRGRITEKGDGDGR